MRVDAAGNRRPNRLELAAVLMSWLEDRGAVLVLDEDAHVVDCRLHGANIEPMSEEELSTLAADLFVEIVALLRGQASVTVH